MDGLLKISSHDLADTRKVDGLRMLHSNDVFSECFARAVCSLARGDAVETSLNPDPRTTFRQPNLRLILSSQAFGTHY